MLILKTITRSSYQTLAPLSILPDWYLNYRGDRADSLLRRIVYKS